MERVKKVLLYIWQLPQNLLGLLFSYYMCDRKLVHDTGYSKCWAASNMRGGISLGQYAFVENRMRYDMNAILHEVVGHVRQSQKLGPFYLIVIGIPSIIWASLYGSVIPKTHNGYYKFYTEKWADKEAGIIRT